MNIIDSKTVEHCNVNVVVHNAQSSNRYVSIEILNDAMSTDNHVRIDFTNPYKLFNIQHGIYNVGCYVDDNKFTVKLDKDRIVEFANQTITVIDSTNNEQLYKMHVSITDGVNYAYSLESIIKNLFDCSNVFN